VWEQVAEAKYDDIKGHMLVMLIGGRATQKACAELEIQNIDSLFQEGKLQLSTGYSDLNDEQIPNAYMPLLTNRFSDFSSISDTKAYLTSGQDEFEAVNYFSEKWIVATQVQALFWYKEFLLGVIDDGILFRDDESIDNKAVNNSAIKNKNSYNVCFEAYIVEYEKRNNGSPSSPKELINFMRNNKLINYKTSKPYQITFDDIKKEISVDGSTAKALKDAGRSINKLLKSRKLPR